MPFLSEDGIMVFECEHHCCPSGFDQNGSADRARFRTFREEAKRLDTRCKNGLSVTKGTLPKYRRLQVSVAASKLRHASETYQTIFLVHYQRTLTGKLSFWKNDRLDFDASIRCPAGPEKTIEKSLIAISNRACPSHHSGYNLTSAGAPILSTNGLSFSIASPAFVGL